MKSYCLKCEKVTENIIPRVSKTRQNKGIIKMSNMRK